MNNNKSIGVYLCKPSNGHTDPINTAEIETYARSLPDVKQVWNFGSLPLSGFNNIGAEIKRAGIERIILAGDTPGMAKPLFSELMSQLGFNGDSVVLASFREHGAINFSDTRKNFRLI